MQMYRRVSEHHAAAHIQYRSVTHDEPPKLEKLSVDTIIEKQYKTDSCKYELFGSAVTKSTQRYSECMEETKRHMEDGQKAIEAGNFAGAKLAYTSALRRCTKALAFASPGKRELAEAYHTRAKILEVFDLDLPALTDMNLALHLIEESEGELMEDLENMKKRLITMVNEKKPKFQDKLVRLSKKYLKEPLPNIPRYGNVPELDYTWIEPVKPHGYETNSNIPEATSKIVFEDVQNIVTQAITIEEICAGDCVMITKPYATMVSEDCLDTHCSHCSLLSPHLIPCPNCSLVMFCCEPCREEAYQQYHKVECLYLKHLMGKKTTTPETLLAMRVVMRLTQQGHVMKLDALMTDKHYKNPFDIKTFKLTEFVESDSDTTLAKIEDNLRHMGQSLNTEMFNTAVSLLHLLRKTTNFFPKEEQNVDSDPGSVQTPRNEPEVQQQPQQGGERERGGSIFHRRIQPQVFEMAPIRKSEQDTQQREGSLDTTQYTPSSRGDEDKLNDREIFVGRLLVKFLCATRYCSRTIQGSKRMFTERGKICPTGSDDIGIGFYPLLNPQILVQSCTPNVMPVYFKNYALLIAVQKLKKNAPVCFSFSGTYWDVDQPKRAEVLKNLALRKCKCSACRNHWPTANSMPEDFPEYKWYCSSLCCWRQSNKYRNLRRASETYQAVRQRCLNNDDIDESAVETIREYSKLLRKYVKSPFKDKVECRVNIARVRKQQIDKQLRQLKKVLYAHVYAYPLVTS